MFGSGHPDGATARARLQSITPRWVPTEADLADAARGHDVSLGDGPAADAPGVARHALPDRPRSAWRPDAAAVRGLASLGLAALAGALVVVVVGWPRGAAAPSVGGGSVGVSAPAQSVLVEPSPSPTTSGVVVVDVNGAIRRPGVFELPSGSRVVDALEAAGGIRPRGDTRSLNLAQVLVDGEQVLVPTRGSAVAPASPGTATPAPGTPATGLVNLNTATSVELETLPGIGPVLAAAILEWRTQNGAFTSVDQLQDVPGIGPVTFADLAPLVQVQ